MPPPSHVLLTCTLLGAFLGALLPPIASSVSASEQASIRVDRGNLLLSIPIGGSLLVNGLDLLAALAASQTQNTLLAASVTSLNATVGQQAAQISDLNQLVTALQANQTVCLLID